MELSTEGLGEGHWSTWEAMGKEDKKKFKRLIFMNVFNFFNLKNICSHASVQEVFMYSNFKTNYPFHIIHGIKTFGYILLSVSFSYQKKIIKEQNMNKKKIHTPHVGLRKKKSIMNFSA